MVEDAGADEFVRDAAILAVAWLTRVGPVPEAETRAWLSRLPAAMQPQAECYVWVSWTECVAVLGLAEFAPDVRSLFERGLIPRRGEPVEQLVVGDRNGVRRRLADESGERWSVRHQRTSR